MCGGGRKDRVKCRKTNKSMAKMKCTIKEDAANANIYKPSSPLKGNSVYLPLSSRLFSVRTVNGTKYENKVKFSIIFFSLWVLTATRSPPIRPERPLVFLSFYASNHSIAIQISKSSNISSLGLL